MTAENAANPTVPDTIVLIHGFWMTPRSWEKWVEHYEGKGYRVLTPTYPGFEGEVEALRLGQAGVGGGYRQLHPRTPGGLRGLQE